MELVSVIIPIYKVEEYLDKCVQSVCTQTYTELEILLVDDGSPDKCPEMCDAYAQKDPRIKVIHKQNGGLGDARNAGVAKAQGKYILFVDSDDWIDRELVETVVEPAERESADIVIFDYAGVDEKGDFCDMYTLGLPENQRLHVNDCPALIMSSCSAVNKLFRRDFWDRTQIKFPKGQYYEDLATIPKMMALAEGIVYEKKVLYYYLMRGGSIMHSRDFSKNYADRTKAVDSVLAFFRERKLEDRYRDELEYLTFEHTFYTPSREIVLNDRKSEYLDKFRKYAYGKYPEMDKNKYVLNMGKKDRILLRLLKSRMYRSMIGLSYIRRIRDRIRKNGG